MKKISYFGDLNAKIESLSKEFNNGEVPLEFENLYMKEIPEISNMLINNSQGLSSFELLVGTIFLAFIDYLESYGRKRLKESESSSMLAYNRVWCIRTGLVYLALEYKQVNENDQIATLFMESMQLRSVYDEFVVNSNNLLEVQEKFFKFCDEKSLALVSILNALSLVELDVNGNAEKIEANFQYYNEMKDQ